MTRRSNLVIMASSFVSSGGGKNRPTPISRTTATIKAASEHHHEPASVPTSGDGGDPRPAAGFPDASEIAPEQAGGGVPRGPWGESHRDTRWRAVVNNDAGSGTSGTSAPPGAVTGAGRFDTNLGRAGPAAGTRLIARKDAG